MPLNHVNAMSSQQQSENMTLTRSKPIAIKLQHPRVVEEDDEREQVEKQFYENSTWRMYNRIVDHRLNTPPASTQAPIHDAVNGWESPALVPAGSPAAHQGLVRPKPRYARAEMPIFGVSSSYNDYSMTEPSFAMGLEDEVFELEL